MWEVRAFALRLSAKTRASNTMKVKPAGAHQLKPGRRTAPACARIEGGKKCNKENRRRLITARDFYAPGRKERKSASPQTRVRAVMPRKKQRYSSKVRLSGRVQRNNKERLVVLEKSLTSACELRISLQLSYKILIRLFISRYSPYRVTRVSSRISLSKSSLTIRAQDAPL